MPNQDEELRKILKKVYACGWWDSIKAQEKDPNPLSMENNGFIEPISSIKQWAIGKEKAFEGLDRELILKKCDYLMTTDAEGWAIGNFVRQRIGRD